MKLPEVLAVGPRSVSLYLVLGGLAALLRELSGREVVVEWVGWLPHSRFDPASEETPPTLPAARLSVTGSELKGRGLAALLSALVHRAGVEVYVLPWQESIAGQQQRPLPDWLPPGLYLAVVDETAVAEL